MKQKSTRIAAALLVLLIVGFGVGTLVNVLRVLDTQDVVSDGVRENLLWNVFQAEKEAMRLQIAVNRLAIASTNGEPLDKAALDRLALRADVFRSRLLLLREGEIGASIAMDSVQRGELIRLELELDHLDRLIEEDAVSLSGLAGAEEAVSSVVATLRGLSNSVVRGDSQRQYALMGRIESAYVNIGVSTAVVASSLFALILILLRSLGRADRSAAEAADARRVLRHALDSIDQGFVYFDAQDRLAIFNERYRQLYQASGDIFRIGMRYEDGLRRGLAEGLYAEAVGREEQWLAERLERHRNPQGPFEQRLSDDRWILVQERRTDDGGVAGVRIDITALKQAQEAAESAGRARSQFLAVMSHELKTPLNALLGMLTLLQEERLPTGSSEKVRSALEASLSLRGIIDAVLEMANLDSGKVNLEEVDFATETVVRGPASLVRGKAAAKNLQLDVVLDPSLPSRLRGDPARIKQVIANLLDNAVKFTKEGEVTLNLTRGEDGASGALTLLCSVRDSGVGIPEEQQETLFVDFSQGERAYIRSAGGPRLGLAICARLVKAMGGRIWVESSSGHGSCFSFEIPIALAAQDGETETSPSEAIQSDARILAVEDNLVNQRLILAYLDRIGVSAEVAENGSEAVERANQSYFDLILMDIAMPVLDGISATEAIRRSNGPCSDVPILALTANAMQEDVERCLEAGMNGHVAKPIDPVRLAQVLRRWLPAKIVREETFSTVETHVDSALLDEAALADLVRGAGAAVASELVVDFLGDLQDRIGDLVEATDQLDRDALTKSGHAIRGAAALFGANEIRELAQQIESEAQQLSRGETYRLVSEMEAASERAKEAFATWRSELGINLDEFDQPRSDEKP